MNQTRVLLHKSIYNSKLAQYLIARANIAVDISELEGILFLLWSELAIPIIFTYLEREIWAKLAVQLQTAAVKLTFDLTIDSELGPQGRDPSRLLSAATSLQSAFALAALKLVPSVLRLALLCYSTLDQFGCKPFIIMLITAFLWAAVWQVAARGIDGPRNRYIAARDSRDRVLRGQISSWELIVLNNRQLDEQARLCHVKNEEDHKQSYFNLHITCRELVLDAITAFGRVLCLFAVSTEDMLLLAEHWTDLLASFKSVWHTVMAFRISLDAEIVSNALVNSTPRSSSGDFLAQCQGNISFNGVYFAYKEGAPALDGVTFEVHPGQAVAIVGGNGAGKTTILRLISQLIKHSRGYIQIDGYNTRDLNERSIRSHIGFVPQDPGLVHGLSIRDNLTYGLENDMNLEDVQGLCQQLGLDQHISRFTAGYDTLIGPGVDLSGGQRQLVTLARVLLRRPPILLLDEPTSQLDNRAQDRVWQLLKAKGVTMLLTTYVHLLPHTGKSDLSYCSHRLSFLSDVNEILVLEEGKIIERGSHDVLISGQTYYRDLFHNNE